LFVLQCLSYKLHLSVEKLHTKQEKTVMVRVSQKRLKS